jgi:TrmH family RNA methyltransferase
MEYITSRTNPLIAHIRRLISDKSYRRKIGEMLCEGPKLLEEALRWDSRIRVIVQTKNTFHIEGISEDTRVVCVPEELLLWISDTKTPQNVLFTCELPKQMLPETLPFAHYLVLDAVQDPGNVGTIWRTADAFGLNGLFLLAHCADPWGAKTIRASMGACFRLPIWEVTISELQDLLDKHEIPLYATALREDAQDVRSVSFERAAVVIGSEGKGISKEVLAICAKALKIPMRDRCESLNAAVAASVVMWEMIPKHSETIV